MPEYSRYGIRFQYPSGWEVTEELDGDQLMISVQSEGTTWWMLSRHGEGVAVEDVAESVLDTFRDEYQNIDVYPAAELRADAVLGYDLEFVCMEMLNSAWLRLFELPGGTTMVLAQGTDHELEETREELDSITESLAFSLFDMSEEGDLPDEEE